MWKFENTSYLVSISLHDPMQRFIDPNVKLCFQSKDQSGDDT